MYTRNGFTLMNFEFNTDHRKVFAEKIIDLVNIAAGGLIFGQFISGQQFSTLTAIIGLIILIAGYIIAYLILKKKRR